jgi:ring-1,2-phenylacetyl-CoA epoxidase subunit PaaE
MARFHSLKVSEIRKETSDCVSVVFEVPAALKQDFKYIQGQYLTLKLKVGGEELRRSYSLSSSPVSETELRVAVKKVANGKGSTYINDVLKQGDMVEVMTPMGNFYSQMNASNSKHYVLFAGGSGITPMFSILKTVLAAEPKSKITLVYGNRDEESIIFREKLAMFEKEEAARLRVIHVLEHPKQAIAELQKGLLTQEKVLALFESVIGVNGDNEYFICGPGPMMENVKQVLEKLKAPKERVHIEYFSAVIDAVAAAEKSSASPGGKVVSKVTIIMDGQEKDFDLASDGPTILDTAISADMDAPFACKGAVCCTCKAKVMEGKATMTMNYALSDAEVEEGYILTCQAHPATDRLVVSYDEP